MPYGTLNKPDNEFIIFANNMNVQRTKIDDAFCRFDSCR
jgi:hypothetical protein